MMTEVKLHPGTPKFYFVEGEGRSRKHKLSFLGILSIFKLRKLKLIV
jgi:hypothetical protein